MRIESRRRARRAVLAAGGVTALLAVLLCLRFVVSAGTPASGGANLTGRPVPPKAEVPEPKTRPVQTLAFPCWACQESSSWPVTFRTDLDLLAPLGNGSGNAAVFFKDFAKPDGSRFAEAEAAMARRVDGPSGLGKILPPGDPLLLEAEPWCDQSTMRFYPDFFALEGWATKVPNLTVPITFARSWVARGLAAKDLADAAKDFRRAIRLGRLLRQEGTTIIADLVGLACIRAGVQGLYDVSSRNADTASAVLAAVVLSECAPQKLFTSERITKFDVSAFLAVSETTEPVLTVPDSRVARLLEAASTEAELRFRGEAILNLNLIRFLGTPGQQEKAKVKLEELSGSKDARVSSLAAWSLKNSPSKKQLIEILNSM